MEASLGEVLNQATNLTRDEAGGALSRKQRRKGRKKAKRSERRQQAAELAKKEEELRLNDPVVQAQEAQRLEKEKAEHDLQEQLWLQREKEAHEEADRRRQEAAEKEKYMKDDDEGEDGWDYVEEGPAEIIWEGNEIIVRKKRVKVPKARRETMEDDQPDSNPLLPESLYENPRSTATHSLPGQARAFEDHKKIVNAKDINPNFGTEQDKTHCPFHIKTGVCRFGVNCSRAHVYPDKSCTILIKNMYNGPGLPLEHDEGLEYTDEEIARNYEEFFEDVHNEFLKQGEVVNFKVCRNESLHLRGNLYVQFKSMDSALAAYNAMNGRFYASKQITCEFVVVPRWRAALCGEYMRSRHKVCSHGNGCNFLHCFENPHGLYEWADWDNPPPRSFSGAGHMGRGASKDEAFYQDRDGYRHRHHSHRRHREGSLSRRHYKSESRSRSRERHDRLHHLNGNHRARRYRGSHSSHSSYEDSSSVERESRRKERRHSRRRSHSSDKVNLSLERDGRKKERQRGSGIHCAHEDNLLLERSRTMKERHEGRHRSNKDKGHDIVEEGWLKREANRENNSRMRRYRSRSQESYKGREHEEREKDASRRNGHLDKHKDSKKARRHESSESRRSSSHGRSYLSSDEGSSYEVTEKGRKHGSKRRDDSFERYRPRSRSSSIDTGQQTMEHETLIKKRKRRSHDKRERDS